ncbi:hypothetical protein HOY82DRAFT_565406 [Tuber indicum]|nr:hypothetical protein HOY82DRAFT_565406 [Tuber indicum]
MIRYQGGNKVVRQGLLILWGFSLMPALIHPLPGWGVDLPTFQLVLFKNGPLATRLSVSFHRHPVPPNNEGPEKASRLPSIEPNETEMVANIDRDGRYHSLATTTASLETPTRLVPSPSVVKV